MIKILRNTLAVMITLVMICSVFALNIVNASAAYENTSSSYNYPIRKIANSGRGFSSSHKGVDLTIEKGTPVYSSKNGTVEIVYSGCKNYNGASSGGQDCKAKGCTQDKVYMSGSGYKAGYYCNNGFGNGVVVKNDDGKFCYYAHLNTVNVKKGDKVTANTKLGEVGSSGCSTGAHLHFSINSKAVGGTSYDPFKYIFPGFKINLTNNGSDSVNPQFRIYFPWTDFEASKCKISFGTSAASLTQTSSDTDVNTNYCFYDLGKKFGNLTKGKTYYVKVSVTKNGTTFESKTYSFVAGSGNKTFLDYSSVASSSIVITFNANGGSCSTANKNVTSGSTYGTLPTPTRSGYKFNGWYTAASGGTKITASSTVSATSNQTLYAQWSCTHSSTEIKNVKGATCTTEGYTGDTYCKICGTKTATGSVIAKKSHKDNNYDGKCDSCGIVTGTAKGRVHSVEIDDFTLEYKGTTILTTYINADANVDYTVSYSSSEISVAAVDENGNVIATGTGNATIICTVTDEFGNVVSDTCNVEVKYNWWQWIIVSVLFGWIWY